MKPVHFSNLKRMAQSPAHYKYYLDEPYPESAAMRIGSAVHAELLGGHYHVYDGIRRGKQWEAFRADHHDGYPILNPAEASTAFGAALATNADWVAGPILRDDSRNTEAPIQWQWLGRECAGRIDLYTDEMLVEVKVTNTTQPDRFARHAFSMGWPAQLAWYNIGLGRPADAPALIIAVESKPPFPVVVFGVTKEALLSGEKQCRLWMERLLVCEADDSWPGYAQTVIPLDLPEWMQDQSLIIGDEEVEL